MNGGPSELKIVYASGTDTGKVRGHNEDYIVVEVPTDAQRRARGMLFVVADGMGGYQAGEVASQRAGGRIIAEYYTAQIEDTLTRLREAMQSANQDVYQVAQSDTALTGMGTTLVAAVVIGREVHVANVGDSRAYLVRQNVITQITKDHSFVNEQVEAGILTPEQARFHPQRNVITRALGSSPMIQVDTYQGVLQEGDVMLLCSDGLTEHVPDEVLRDVALNCEPERAVQRLIELAREGGGSDNISVIVLRAESAQSSAGAQPPVAQSQPLAAGVSVAPAASVRSEPAPVAYPPAAPLAVASSLVSPPTTRSGAPLLWMAGGLAIALLAVMVLVGGALFVARLGQNAATPTPTSTLDPHNGIAPAQATWGVLPTLLPPTAKGAATSTIAPLPPTSVPRPLLPMSTTTVPMLLSTPEPGASPSFVTCPANQQRSGEQCDCPPDTVWDAEKQWCAPVGDDDDDHKPTIVPTR